jgi:hypothetical protein
LLNRHEFYLAPVLLGQVGIEPYPDGYECKKQIQYFLILPYLLNDEQKTIRIGPGAFERLL